MRLIPVVALIGVLLSLPLPALAQSATPEAASVVPDSDDFAGLVDIGGRSIYLECHGTGSPTVVLVAGGGAPRTLRPGRPLHGRLLRAAVCGHLS